MSDKFIPYPMATGPLPVIVTRLQLATNRTYESSLHHHSDGAAQGKVAIGGDGQVTLGTAIMKADAMKIRRLGRRESHLRIRRVQRRCVRTARTIRSQAERFSVNVPRAATELAKEWRTDRALRRLGSAAGRGRCQAHAAGHGHGRCDSTDRRRVGHRFGRQVCGGRGEGLLRHSSLSAAEIVRKSLEIAAGIDIYTNTNIVVEELAERSERIETDR